MQKPGVQDAGFKFCHNELSDLVHTKLLPHSGIRFSHGEERKWNYILAATEGPPPQSPLQRGGTSSRARQAEGKGPLLTLNLPVSGSFV